MIKTIFKFQPRIQEVANNLVFVHPEVKRHSVGWEVKGQFLADKENGGWKDALKRSHQLLASSDTAYDFNVLNSLLDIKVKTVEIANGVPVVVFRNITRTLVYNRPCWKIERREEAGRFSKYFFDRDFRNNWELSLKAATTFLLKHLKCYFEPEAPLSYPKLSAFLFKHGQVRLSVATSSKSIAAYVDANQLDQESLNKLVDSLYCEWVWYQCMVNRFGDQQARGIRKPEKLDYWRRDNFPTITLDELLNRIKH